MRPFETRRSEVRWLVRAALSAFFAVLLTGCAYVPGTASPIEQYQKRLAQQKALNRAADAAALDSPAVEEASFEDKLRDGDRARDHGDIPRALLDYVQAHGLDPEDPRPRERIGFLHLSEDPQGSELIFTELAEADPDSAVAYLGLGLSQLAQDRTDDARASLERSVALDGDSAVAQYALSVTRDLHGDRDGAFECAKRAYELAPSDARIVANLGVSHMLRGEYETAEKLLRRAILLSPGTAAHHNNLGLTLGLMQRYHEALASFEVTGTDQSSHNNLGYVYFLNGEYDRAIAEYEIALLAEGDDEEAILRNLVRVLDVVEHEAKNPAPTPVAVRQAIDRDERAPALTAAAVGAASGEAER
jgi:superkiller protein 3